jgi:hypothetical protein
MMRKKVDVSEKEGLGWLRKVGLALTIRKSGRRETSSGREEGMTWWGQAGEREQGGVAGDGGWGEVGQRNREREGGWEEAGLASREVGSKGEREGGRARREEARERLPGDIQVGPRWEGGLAFQGRG